MTHYITTFTWSPATSHTLIYTHPPHMVTHHIITLTGHHPSHYYLHMLTRHLTHTPHPHHTTPTTPSDHITSKTHVIKFLGMPAHIGILGKCLVINDRSMQLSKIHNHFLYTNTTTLTTPQPSQYHNPHNTTTLTTPHNLPTPQPSQHHNLPTPQPPCMSAWSPM